jgi:hypothetical protein
MTLVRLVCALATQLAASAGYAAERVGTPADYLWWLAKLQPGDVLRLAPGQYARGLPIHDLHGEPGAPIVIAGPAKGTPAILLGRRGANTVSIKDSSHIEIRNLRLDGMNLPVDGVKLEGTAGFAHDITLENLTLIGFGHDQQIVGISTQAPAWKWIVRNNVIVGAGTGMYFGGSDGSRPFVHGLIEGNLIVDTVGYNVQIKHQKERASVAGMPDGPSRTIIRHNVFSKATNASGGEFARPNLLVGHFPPRGSGADDEYVIYGNFFYQNPVEALFQGEGNVAFYNNVLVNTRGDAIRVQPHYDKPRKIRIFHNTILARDVGVHLQGADESAYQLVARNVVVAAKPIVGRDDGGNVAAAFERAGELFRAAAAPPGAGLNLTLRQPTMQTSLPALQVSDLPGADLDFEGKPRAPTDVGAYASAPKVRWPLQLARKPVSSTVRQP